MATGFDREIDALLRAKGKTRLAAGPRSLDVEHIDADEISAFVENVMPTGARQRYTAHFADCDACRGLLKDVMVLGAEEPVGAAAPVAAEEAVAKLPWYRQLFVTQRLAYGMGALVLLFSGFLGYLVLQNGLPGMGDRAATFSEEAGNTRVRGPMESQPMMANANAASNMADVMTSSNAASNAAQSYEDGGGGGGGRVSTQANPAATGSATADAAAVPAEDDEVIVRTERGDPSTLAAAAAPAPPAAAESREAAERESQLRARQQAIPSAGSPSVTQSGPNRRSMDRDNRAEDLAKMNRGVAADAVTTRVVGGKTFDQKGDVWYDRAYTDQPITNIRRNTPAYRELNRNMRVIAESLPGVVVVVSQNKAFRIQ